jgi:uncharacterized protein YjdB
MKINRKFRTAIVAVFIAALAAAPFTASAAPKFTATTPSPAVNTVYVKKGDSIKITGRHLPKGDKVKSYTTSKKDVATISAKGKLKARKAGTTTVTLTTKKGRVDTIKVKVVAKNKPAKKIRLPKTKSMRVKQVKRLSVKVTPTNSTSTVKWSSSDKKIASVDAAGYITPKKAGKVKITAKTSNGKKAVCTVTVLPLIKATGVTVTPDKATILYKQKLKLEAALTSADPNAPSNDVIEWSSSNENIATVEGSGKTAVVTSVAGGEVKITATAVGSGKKASAVIKVSSIKANHSSVRVPPGVKFKPEFTTYGLGDAPKLTYSSNKNSIATVSEDGYVQVGFRNEETGEVKEGTVTIKAKTEAGDAASMKVTVMDEPTIVDLSKWQGNIKWEETYKAVDLAILRVAYGDDTSYEPKYKSYSSSCNAYGVPFGVYSFALYKTKAAAEREATTLYEQATAGGRAPLFFIVDIEESYIKSAHTDAYIAKLRELAEEDGIARLKVGVYIGHHLYNKLGLNLDTDPDDPESPDFVWIPRYNTPNNGSIDTTTAKRPDFACDIWQYTSGAYLPGITGKVDVNTLYDPSGAALSEKEGFSFAWLTAGSDSAPS